MNAPIDHAKYIQGTNSGLMQYFISSEYILRVLINKTWLNVLQTELCGMHAVTVSHITHSLYLLQKV